MGTASEWLSGHVKRDHEWLLGRLRSLDNCLDNILYFGELGGDMRGFAGLRLRCAELREVLAQHIPEEERAFARLEGHAEVRPLLAALTHEHRALGAVLEQVLKTLDALRSGDPLPEDLFTLQDRVRKLSGALQHHIQTENEMVLPLIEAT